ncbi:EipB family protein [Roseomonas sp. HF4]|uniref:EipB family protein n=1 Tax=Roseomonas sp. HF4 TaxID=2562313 RepID=UPI0010C0E3FA|nr:DUF1849 family protein [Roseomonas sp. HF4]
MRLRLIIVLGLAAVLAAPAGHAQAPVAGAAGAVPLGQPIEARHLAPHRAAYRLSLESTRRSGNIARADGAMLYELVDACDGWATRQRFSLTIADQDGTEIETASDYSTYESRDGRRLRFTLTQMTQGAVTTRIAGEAELAADGTGTVRYTEPEAKEERLPPGTLLPNVHTLIALNAAREGRRLLVAPLFDGTSEDGAQDSTTVMSAWDAPREVPGHAGLSALGSVRMRIAFFDREAQQQGGGATTPSYEVSLRYWENGVADELSMDFREFVVSGRMVKLEPVPGGC